MSEARWAERDTSPERIEAALRELLRERHAENETLVPARVLNLIVIADREWRGEVVNRLERVGRYHPSRTILCTVEDDRRTIDGYATVSGDVSSGGGVGVLRESVEIALGRRAHGPARHDHRPDPDLRAADRRVVAAQPRRGGGGAAADRRRDPDRHRRPRLLRRTGSGAGAGRRPAATPTWTWSTSPGCARSRGASGWPAASRTPRGRACSTACGASTSATTTARSSRRCC